MINLKFKDKKIEARDIQEGHMGVLLALVKRTEEALQPQLLENKEDIRLYQGYLQALKAIREVISP